MTALLLDAATVLAEALAFVAGRLAAKPDALPYLRAGDEWRRLQGTATDWANLAREQRREGARLAR